MCLTPTTNPRAFPLREAEIEESPFSLVESRLLETLREAILVSKSPHLLSMLAFIHLRTFVSESVMCPRVAHTSMCSGNVSRHPSYPPHPFFISPLFGRLLLQLSPREIPPSLPPPFFAASRIFAFFFCSHRSQPAPSDSLSLSPAQEKAPLLFYTSF